MEARADATTLFETAKRMRSFEDIVTQIRDAILTGRLKKGERLPNERELCRIFGVSRPTLREALRTLEALGVIEIRPGSAGGIFVIEPDGGHVGSALEALIRFRAVTAQELAEFRTSFEGETAYRAALLADSQDLEELETIVSDFVEAAAREGVPWQYLVDTDIRFHEAISRASKNQVRVAIMLAIHRALHRASASIAPYASSEVRRGIGAELAAIAQAVRQKNARLARTRMRRHVKRFSELERSIEEGQVRNEEVDVSGTRHGKKGSRLG